jgi:hypothetical protein
MKFVLLLFLVFAASPLLAQDNPTESEVTREQLMMTSFAPDTAAEAIILFDKGEHVELADMTFRRHRRVKILKKEAFDKWGTVTLTEDRSSVGKIRGTTYNLKNGQIVKTELQDNAIFRIPKGKQSTEIRFTFPNLEVGSIIEYSYKVTEKTNRFNLWTFQEAIPNLWSEYSLHAPDFSGTPVVLGVIQPAETETKYNGSYRRWVLKDIPAFRSEPLMPLAHDYVSRLYVPRGTWSEVHYAFSGLTVTPLPWSKDLKEKAMALTLPIQDSLEKVKAISAFIKANVTWNGVCDSWPDPPGEIVIRKKGTASDINFLFACMLEAAGFKPSVALISTRENGILLKEHPSMRQLNYLLCYLRLKKNDLLLDATEPLLSFDALPERCLNRTAFHLLPMGYRWLPVTTPAKDKTVVTAHLSLEEENLRGTLMVDRAGYDAFAARVDHHAGEEAEYFKHTLLQKTWTVTKKEVLRMEDVDTPVREQYEVSIPGQVIVSNERLYIDPYIALKEEVNPFPETHRKYPLDLPYSKEKVLLCHITIPEGYEVETLPKNKNITLPGKEGSCVFNISWDGEKVLSVLSQLRINETFFYPEEYNVLREFYARIIAKQTEPIVLRKKS